MVTSISGLKAIYSYILGSVPIMEIRTTTWLSLSVLHREKCLTARVKAEIPTGKSIGFELRDILGIMRIRQSS